MEIKNKVAYLLESLKHSEYILTIFDSFFVYENWEKGKKKLTNSDMKMGERGQENILPPFDNVLDDSSGSKKYHFYRETNERERKKGYEKTTFSLSPSLLFRTGLNLEYS